MPKFYFLLFFAVFVLLNLFSSPALAHAILVSSNPRDRSVVAESQLPVELVFNSRIDQARSQITLEGPPSTETTVPIVRNPGQPAKLSGTLDKLTPGAYKLHWQVLSVDGHITRGIISFQVK